MQLPAEHQETVFETIYQLAKRKDEAALNKLVESGASIGVLKNQYDPVMLLAAQRDNEGVEFLITKFNASLKSAMKGAAMGHHVELVNYLIKCAVSLNSEVELVKYFLSIYENSAEFALGVAAESNHVELVNALIKLVTNLEIAVWHAAKGGHIELVKDLIQQGARLDYHDKLFKMSALHVAARNGQTEMVELLLAGGAQVNIKDSTGLTPLHKAAMYAHSNTTMVELLLTKGVEINKRDSKGLTPLHCAVCNNHGAAAVKLLLERGAEINIKDSSGETALYRAAYNGYTAQVELLLAEGADIDKVDFQHKTSLQVAETKNQKEVIAVLTLLRAPPKKITDLCREYKDIIQETGQPCYSMLHIALLRGNIPLAQELIKQYPDLLIKKNATNVTPLSIIQGSGQFNCLKPFIKGHIQHDFYAFKNSINEENDIASVRCLGLFSSGLNKTNECNNITETPVSSLAQTRPHHNFN